MNKSLRGIIALIVVIILLLGFAKGGIITALRVVGAGTEVVNSVNSTETSSSSKGSTPVLGTTTVSSVPVYVLYNTKTDRYLYTTNLYEEAELVQTGWFLKSVMKTVAIGAAVYRFYNPKTGEHFYTENIYEKTNLIKANWHYEGIAFRVTTTRTNSPVYRLYSSNTGVHYFTTNLSEKSTLVKSGWRYESIAWYFIL